MEVREPPSRGGFIARETVVMIPPQHALEEDECDDDDPEDLVEVDELRADGKVDSYSGGSEDEEEGCELSYIVEHGWDGEDCGEEADDDCTKGEEDDKGETHEDAVGDDHLLSVRSKNTITLSYEVRPVPISE